MLIGLLSSCFQGHHPTLPSPSCDDPENHCIGDYMLMGCWNKIYHTEHIKQSEGVQSIQFNKEDKSNP